MISKEKWKKVADDEFNKNNPDNINYQASEIFDDSDFDLPIKLGITDYLYLDTGIDLRRLKRLNPKNHVIFW